MGLIESIRKRIEWELSLDIDPKIQERVTEFLEESPGTRVASVMPRSAWLDRLEVINPDGSRQIHVTCIEIKEGEVVETFTCRFTTDR